MIYKVKLIIIILAVGSLVVSCVTPSMITSKELFTGNTFSNKHDFINAIVHYQNYLEKSKTLGKYRNLSAEADVNRKIAYVFSTSGQYDKTIAYLTDARSLDSIDNDKVSFAEDVRLLGMANAYSNRYDESLRFLSKALALTNGFDHSIKEQKQQVVADIYLSLAKIYAALGDFSLSNKYIQKSLIIYEKINDTFGKSQALHHLAWLQFEDGNYLEAKRNLSISVENAKKLKLYTFEQMNTQSDVSEKEGKYEDALRCRLDALAQADSSKILPQIIWSYIKVGDSYRLLGSDEKAMNCYMNALKLNKSISQSNLSPLIDYRTGNKIGAFRSFSKNGIKYGIGISALKIGEMFKEEHPDSSLFYYNQALEVFKTLHNQESLYLANLLVSDLYIEQGMDKKAIEILLPMCNDTSCSEILWQSSFFLAKAYENIGSDSLAIGYYKNSIETIEKIRGTIVLEEFRDSYFSNKVVVYDKLIQLLQKKGKANEAWSYTEKARARNFLDMIEGQKIGESQKADSALIKKEQRLQTEISNLLKTEFEENIIGDSLRSVSPTINKKLKDKQEEYNQVLDQLSASQSKYLQLVSATTIDLKQLQQKIKDDQVLIEYWCGNDSLFIYVITKDSLKATSVDITNNQLKNKIIRFRNTITLTESEVVTSLKDLYNTLWKPIEQYVPENKRVCIIPHQYLHYVPFAALIKGDKYLVERYLVSNSVSASLFRDELPSPSSDTFLGIALNHSNVGTFNTLLNTEQEVKLAQKYFTNSTLAIDDQLSESLVKELMPKASIIHFATHGFYNEQDPMRSYLLLNSDSKNDGLLTAFEIFNSSVKAKLTTLSACQTSLGKISKGDEINSLNRAFLYAGSSNVISTLWNISDKSTPKLINDFYSLYNQGDSFVNALCKAQRKFIKQTSSNPILWSAFVLYN